MLRVRNLGSIVVRRMLEVRVSGGSGTHEHKRDTTVYPGSGYPAVRSSSYSRAPKSGVTMKENESLVGSVLLIVVLFPLDCVLLDCMLVVGHM